MKKIDKRAIIFHACYLRLVACTKHQLIGFIFNNVSLFVNPWLDFLCGDDVNINKIKKNKFLCHAVTGKLLVEWSLKKLW